MGIGPVFRFMRTYNRRFAEIARRRRTRRMLGKTNCAHRCLIPGFKLHSTNPKLFVQGFAKWARVELGELFSQACLDWFHRRKLVLRAAEHKKFAIAGRDRQNARRMRLQKITAADKDRHRR